MSMRSEPRSRKTAVRPAAPVKHDAARVEFRLRISRGEDIAVGPGKIDLLEAIASTGSITAAAKKLGMSYRRAWLLVDTMNRCFDAPVVAAEAGGSRGGGTRVTPLGAEVVRRYRRVETSAARAGAADLAALTRLLRR
jgi:molybdate transport system regulatory protein